MTLLVAAVIAAALTVTACGASGTSGVVATVDKVAITVAMVDRQMAIIEHAQGAPRPSTARYRALLPQALGSLISDEWIIREAAEEGIDARDEDVARTLARLRAHVMTKVPGVTEAEIASYYNQHRRRFVSPELREFEAYEPDSVSVARTVKRELLAGNAAPYAGLHESLERPARWSGLGGKEAFERAVFSARPNVPSGPVKFFQHHIVFVVTEVVPPTIQPLTEVRDEVKGQVAAENQRQALLQFLSSWRTKWRSMTSCRPGYVVPECKQYRGPATAEDRLRFR